MLFYYAQCHYAEFHVLFIIMPNVIMLSVVILNVVMLSVVAPNELGIAKRFPVCGILKAFGCYFCWHLESF
jgi:hypothetical protein